MDKNAMTYRLRHAVELYIEDEAELGPDIQAAIDPKDFTVNIQTAGDRDNDIDDSDATVEADAVAEGLADQDGMDYQSSRNWDLYPMHEFVKRGADGKLVPDDARIAAIVDKYAEHPVNSRTPYTF